MQRRTGATRAHRLVLVFLLALGACTDPGHETRGRPAGGEPGEHAAGDDRGRDGQRERGERDEQDERSEGDEQDELDVPIDVAGHLTIAALEDSGARFRSWHWGAVPVGIAVGEDGSVYWAQYRTGTIERVDAEGNGREVIASVDGPLGIAFDRPAGRLYYAADRNYPRSIGTLGPDGKPKALVYGMRVNRPFAIAVSERGSRLYWTESINGRIQSASVTGTDPGTVFDDGIANVDEAPDAVAQSPAGIAVDAERGQAYWSDIRSASIFRAGLDGSDRTAILGPAQNLVFPTALAVDAKAGKLYWADPGTESIGCANLDGSEPETLAGSEKGVIEPYGLAVDPERRLLYWTDVARNALYRARLDSRQVDLFVSLDPATVAPGADGHAASSCDAQALDAEREFLRHWLKRVRTCVLAVSATKAVMRSATDLRSAARVCGRELAAAADVEPLRSALERSCDGRAAAAAIDRALDAGARILAADLPRSAAYLRAIRPFLPSEMPAGARSSADLLAALDDLRERIARAIPPPARALDADLPATGQTTTYRAATRMAGGAASVGDDGAVRAGKPLGYVDNGDGTISDPTTGLMWEKKCDGCGDLHDFNVRHPWRSQKGMRNAAEWLEAINAEGGTGFAGHDDWRLPEIGELVSIVDFESFNPAVNAAFDGTGCGRGCPSHTAPECSCTQLGAYWTSGNSPRPDDVVPVVAFSFGAVFGQPADGDAFVRAVRGGDSIPKDRFLENGDGTVTDRATGLMWEKKCLRPRDLHDVDLTASWSYDGKEETIWDWLALINSEGGSGFAGHADWRIPNVKELFSLFDGRHQDPSIDRIFAAEGCEEVKNPACSLTVDGLYWTSTTFADFPALALAVGFNTPGELEDEPPPWVIRVVGGVEPHMKTLRMAVRAVRGPVETAP